MLQDHVALRTAFDPRVTLKAVATARARALRAGDLSRPVARPLPFAALRLGGVRSVPVSRGTERNPALEGASTMVSSNSNKPDATKHLAVYTVRKNGEKSIWVRIGAAFPNRDGKGFNVRLDALPLDGELVIREPLPTRDDE